MAHRRKATTAEAALVIFCAAAAALLALALIPSTASSAFAEGSPATVAAESGGATAENETDSPYEITIPADLTIGSNGTGSMTVEGAINEDDLALSVSASSANGGRLKSSDGGEAPYELADGSFSQYGKGNFSHDVKAEVTSAPSVPGTYTDTVTFTISSYKAHTLTFDSQDGSSCGSRVVAEGSPYGDLPNPTKSGGFAFDGWYTAALGGQKATGSEPMGQQDVTLYAHWRVSKLTINYHSGGAQKWQHYPNNDIIELGGADVVVQVETVPYNLSYNQAYGHSDWGLLNVTRLTKTGYHAKDDSANGYWYWLKGSASAPESVKVSSQTPLKDETGQGVAEFIGVSIDSQDAVVDLYPLFEANSYNIIYDGNGADGGSMTASKCEYDTPISLSKNAFTKSGYVFKGWKGSDGKVYQDEQEVCNLTATRNGTIALYAIWELAAASDSFEDVDSEGGLEGDGGVRSDEASAATAGADSDSTSRLRATGDALADSPDSGDVGTVDGTDALVVDAEDRSLNLDAESNLPAIAAAGVGAFAAPCAAFTARTRRRCKGERLSKR